VVFELNFLFFSTQKPRPLFHNEGENLPDKNHILIIDFHNFLILNFILPKIICQELKFGKNEKNFLK